MSLDFDFELPPELAARVNASASRSSRSNPPSPNTLASDGLTGDFDFDGYASTPAGEPDTGSPSPSPSVSFDWDALNLDIGTPADAKTAVSAPSLNNSLLETKLSLAQELKAMGNLDGARSLAQEVMAEADDRLRSKVAAFLANLS